MRTLLILSVLFSAGCATVRTPRDAQVASLSNAQLVEVADALAQAGDSVRAQQYLLMAERQGASDVLPRLMRSYIADGQYRLAIEHADNYLRRHPRALRMRELLASLYAAVGYREEAIEQFEEVVAHEPKNAEAHYALAAMLREGGGAYERIDAHYRAYLAIEPRGEHAEEARAGLLEQVP